MLSNKYWCTKVRRKAPIHLHWSVIFVIIAVLSFSLYFDSLLEVPALDGKEKVYIEDGWTLSIDSSVIKDPVSLPFTLDKKIKNKEIRITNTFPTSNIEHFDSLSVRTSMTSLDLQIEGETIYSFGHTTGWKKPVLGGGFTHIIPLPSDIEGKEFTLVYTYTSNNLFAGSLKVPVLAKESTLIIDLLIEWPSLIFGGMFFIIGLAAVIISTRVTSGEEKQSVLYFGLIESAIGAWVLTQTSSKFFIIRNPILPLNFSILALYLLPFFLIQYVNSSYRIIKRKTTIFIHASYLFIFAYIIGGFGQLFGWFEYTDMLPFAGLALGLFIISLSAVLVKDYFEGNRELITFIYAIAVLLITVIAEEILMLLKVTLADAVILHIGMGITGGILLFQTLRVISQHRQSSYKEQKLLELAFTDALTGLNNRMAYDKQITQIMKNKKYYDVIGVIVCDINDLKRMNDTYGHSCGDEVLRDFSYQIVKLVPYGTDVFRIGGDEFVAFIPRITEEQLEIIAHSIQHHPLKISYGPYSVAVGYKRCVFTSPCNLVNIIIEADKKMYECKKLMKENCR